MTKEEFFNEYARNSNITPERLRELKQVSVACSCDYEECKGWIMITVGQLDEYHVY